MKRCPYCDTPLHDQARVCPSCGAGYWEPDRPPDEREGTPDEQSGGGCLALLALPLGVSLAVFAGLIAGGFLLGKLLNWDSLAVRFIWIAVSAGVGLRLFDRMRKPDPNDDDPPPEKGIES